MNFRDAHLVARVVVAVRLDGNVEIKAVVDGIGIVPAHIVGNAARAEHRAGAAEGNRLAAGELAYPTLRSSTMMFFDIRSS